MSHRGFFGSFLFEKVPKLISYPNESNKCSTSFMFRYDQEEVPMFHVLEHDFKIQKRSLLPLTRFYSSAEPSLLIDLFHRIEVRFF